MHLFSIKHLSCHLAHRWTNRKTILFSFRFILFWLFLFFHSFLVIHFSEFQIHFVSKVMTLMSMTNYWLLCGSVGVCATLWEKNKKKIGKLSYEYYKNFLYSCLDWLDLARLSSDWMIQNVERKKSPNKSSIRNVQCCGELMWVLVLWVSNKCRNARPHTRNKITLHAAWIIFFRISDTGSGAPS